MEEKDRRILCYIRWWVYDSMPFVCLHPPASRPKITSKLTDVIEKINCFYGKKTRYVNISCILFLFPNLGCKVECKIKSVLFYTTVRLMHL